MLAQDTQARRLVWLGVAGPRLEMFAGGVQRLALQGAADERCEARIPRLADALHRDTDLLQHGGERATDVDGAAVGICCHTTSIERVI